MEDLKRQIEELNNKLSEKDRLFDELKNEISQIKKVQESHTHSGNDGSDYMYNNPISLKSGVGISCGRYQFIDAELQSSSTDSRIKAILGALVIGDGAKGSGTDNSVKNTSQFYIEHQPLTNGSTNQTFIQGYRSPFYSDTSAVISSGGTTLTQSKFTWELNELDGAYVIVIDPANPTQFDAFEIASNTATQLTITGGTWTFTSLNAEFAVFVPIYLGSANFPWRRIYTGDGSGGGIRFGMGDTNGGQNALLYTDGADLKFRKKDGTVTTVTVS